MLVVIISIGTKKKNKMKNKSLEVNTTPHPPLFLSTTKHQGRGKLAHHAPSHNRIPRRTKELKVPLPLPLL
jgi:hypothetical protein